MKIGIVTLYDEAYREFGAVTASLKRDYCQKHGYDFIEDDSKTDMTRHLAWSKIPAILEYLPKYDYLVWMDADTLIMNPEKRLEEFRNLKASSMMAPFKG
jgi:hypothetical protein